MVLSYAAVRATVRELRGINNWEKTAHVGAHRQDAGQLAESPVADGGLEAVANS